MEIMDLSEILTLDDDEQIQYQLEWDFERYDVGKYLPLSYGGYADSFSVDKLKIVRKEKRWKLYVSLSYEEIYQGGCADLPRTDDCHADVEIIVKVPSGRAKIVAVDGFDPDLDYC